MSSSYASSGENQPLQVQYPCYCGLPSRLKTSRTPNNPGGKFRVCLNCMKLEKCSYWVWADEDVYNPTLKVAAMEYEMRMLKMKMEWKLFIQKFTLFGLFVMCLYNLG